ncbi:hypothetical protein [Yokenella regensburgei]|uniref:hypothetical protein n=1 Tax=Yokenella regensburgei TaxID=158877 RepID=UPI0013764514|nr:hypothetical protein [Yokenella regensburgei]KAF1371383.1 hypothetical protein FHR25_000510 [Yokenella regensburgei]
MKKLLVGLVVILMTGCATSMSERASHVQVISQDAAKQYEFVANVSGSSTLTGVARHTGYQNAMNELLDNAAKIGAQFVVIDPASAPSYWTTSEVIRATAFKKK